MVGIIKPLLIGIDRLVDPLQNLGRQQPVIDDLGPTPLVPGHALEPFGRDLMIGDRMTATGHQCIQTGADRRRKARVEDVNAIGCFGRSRIHERQDADPGAQKDPIIKAEQHRDLSHRPDP